MSRPSKPKAFQAEWHGVQLQIHWEKNWLSTGMGHLEIRAVAPEDAILPVTLTGYRSHFIPSEEVMNEGGPVSYVTAWLDAVAANSPEWEKREAESRQLKLF